VTRRALALGVVGMMLVGHGAISCVDFEAPRPVNLPDSLVANPSLARDIQPIFTARCATASCHTVVTQQAELVLETTYSHSDLVNVQSVTNASMPRVTPGDASQSWLVYMISADDEAREGHPRMPLGRTPLTDNQIGSIVNWINQGAPNN
jgi:hypothetical protein